VAVEFNTLSKSHNMAGWRVGVLAGNAQVIKTLFTLKTNTDSGHFRPILEAAVAALTGDQEWVAARNQVYRQRRDILVAGLRGLGFQVVEPQASHCMSGARFRRVTTACPLRQPCWTRRRSA